MSIKLKGATSGSVSLDVPAAVSGGDVSLTLPNGVGSSGQYLRNTGTAGTLEFGDLPATSITTADMPAGSIIQVKQLYLQTTGSTAISANTVTDVSGMSLAITPTSANNDILITMRWTGEHSTTSYNSMFGMKRDSTVIGGPTSPGVRAAGHSPYLISYQLNSASTLDQAELSFMDSPNTTSSVTYKLTWRNDTAGTLYNNRTKEDVDNPNYERGTSTIILMEVAR
tara:strand:- start:991 stop:1668 length:678 start_codon:yes stop_codon:yes gene_type:complete